MDAINGAKQYKYIFNSNIIINTAQKDIANMEATKERADSMEEEKDESFIDKPAILDKYKAAA